MKKRLSVVSKTAAAVSALGIGLLLLISCNNILTSPHEGNAEGNGGTGTALFSFGNGVEGTRTLVPSGVTFDHYDLTITSVPAGTTVNRTISSGSSDTIELSPGDWKVHVDAYTAGSNKAAEGDADFKVSPNTTTPVDVVLIAISGAGNGTLSVDISGSLIDVGHLDIFAAPDFDYPAITSVPINSSGLTLDISLPAGQYRVYAEIYDTEPEHHAAYINEVAYIYSNLSTPLTREMTPANFTAMTTISGTVQYKINGADQGGYSLSIFTTDMSGPPLTMPPAYISSPGAAPYTLRIPRPDKDITLYIVIDDFSTQVFARSISLTAGQMEAENVAINLDRGDYFDLSGSVAFTVGGAPATNINISAGGFSVIVSGDKWSISGIPAGFSGPLDFYMKAEYGGQWLPPVNVGSWTPGSPTTGISLRASYITVSGSFTVTANESPLSEVPVYIDAFREFIPGSGYFNEYLGGAYGSWSGNTYNWSFDTVVVSPSTQVELEINIVGNHITDTLTLGTTDVTIPSKVYAFTFPTLKGTLDTVTVNGNTPSYVDIYARDSGDGQYYYGPMGSGNWEIPLPDDFSGTLTIGVEAGYNGGWYEKDVTTVTVSGSPVTGIALGNVAITFTPISGTVTTDGINSLSSGWLYVFDPSVMPDYSSQPLGNAEIIDGNFLGYVTGGLTSGYVVISSGGDYITKSPVTLGSSMSFNLSEMTQLSY